MGWSHPDISLPDLVVLLKGFVDIVVLTSGRQSCGLPAHWDAQNVKKALQWALFFEEVFQRITDSVNYQESVKEMDAALGEITSDPSFPRGLAHLSSATLMNARDFVVECLLKALPLRDTQLHALLSAVVELDFDDPRIMQQPEPFVFYVNKLALHETSRDMPESKRVSTKQLETLHSNSSMENIVSYSSHSEFVLEGVVKKHKIVSGMLSVEASLDTLSEIITKSAGEESISNIWQEQGCDNLNKKMDGTVGYDLWSRWRSGCLSYLLSKRTLKLMSGVSLIFCCPKNQWIQALESVRVLNFDWNGDLLEMIELCLLGLMSSTWNQVIEQFTSCSYEVVSVSKLYHDMHNLLLGGSALQVTDKKESDILEYLSSLLESKLFLLWQLPPVLVSAGLRSWSSLFHRYVGEIEKQILEGSTASRYCSCDQHGKEHTDCEIAERAWCIYVYHVRGQIHIH